MCTRRIVRWNASGSLKTDLALDVLEQAIWSRQHESVNLDGLVDDSDRGMKCPLDPLQRPPRRERARRLGRLWRRLLR